MNVPDPTDGAEGSRGWWADRVWLPWIDRVRPLRDSVVLEFGCGPGSVSRAVAPRVARLIGLDVNEGYIDIARRLGAAADQGNSTFHSHPPHEIVAALRSFAGRIDIVLLYAVLEHLTVTERLEVLTAAREVARPSGVIAVIETPNRLSEFDQHSSWMPFANQVPDDLALLSADRSPRPEFREQVLSASDPMMALTRFGRSVSYHEFEAVWNARLADHVLACNWGPEVHEHREVDPGEIALARAMARRRPDLDPCWSRQWIDLILSPEPVLRRQPVFWPWTGMAGPASRDIVSQENDVHYLGQPCSALHVELREPTRHVALRIVDGETRTGVTVETLAGEVAEGQASSRPGFGVTVSVDLSEPADDLLVRLPTGGWIIAVMYAGFGVC